MSFLDPLFLAGLGVAAVPVVIHLINRRKARLHRFAALEFVLRSQKRTARKWKIKQFLLLLVRTLAILAIPLALARPYLSLAGGTVASLPGGVPASVVFVVDDSMSMAWDEGSGSLIEQALGEVRQAVGNLGEGDNAAIILAGSPARAVVPELTFDRAALLAALDEVTAAHRSTALAGALGLAWGLLETSALEARRVVVLTDAQAAGFDLAKLPWPAGGGPQVIIRDLTRGELRANRAVVGVQAAPAPEAGPFAWRFQVSVAAAGMTEGGRAGDDAAEVAAVETQVSLEVDGRVVAQGFVSPSPGDVEIKTFTAPIGGDGVRRGRVLLGPAGGGGDGLRLDDERAFSLRVRPSLQVLVVNGDPRTIPYSDEVFYLEKALLPGAGAGSRLRPRVVQTSALASMDLAGVDVVFLANVGEAPPGAASTLESWVRRGGGLIVSAGDRMAGPGGRWMDGLLPAPVRGVRRLGRDTGAPPVRLGPPPAGLPMFDLFRGTAGEGLRAATFDRYLLVSPGPDDQRTTLLSFGDGAPALLERQLGEGRVLLLTSTVDRDWSDLAVSTGFLPLMQEACHHVARSAIRSSSKVAVYGATVHVPPPSTARDADWQGPPEGRRVAVAAEALQALDGVALPAGAAPGVHTITFRDRVGRVVSQEDVVVVAPGEESDLTPLAADVVAALSGAAPLAKGGPLAGTPPPDRRADLWPWSLLLLIFLLLAETSLLVRRRRPMTEAAAGYTGGSSV